MFISSQFRRKLASAGLILLLCACTPALNWRDIRWQTADGSALKAILPCKADTATRKQQLGEFQVELSMMGCVANDATFTLSRIPLVDSQVALKVLAAWQAAAVANIKTLPASTNLEAKSPASVSGAGAWPPSERVTLTGANTQAQMLWFAKQGSTGMTLYQAAVYSKQSQNIAQMSDQNSAQNNADKANIEAATTFFESLQLQ